jgi:D-lactate dehydrogenase (cytochrome)
LPESPLLLLEFHGSEAGVAEQAEIFGAIAEEFGALGFEWTTNPEERNRLWQARHDAYWAQRGLRPKGESVATDVCVPVSKLAACVDQAQEKAKALDLIAPIVGHVGDGNFHVTPIVDMEDADELERARGFVSWLNDLAISMDGTCTGEHGIGQGKTKYLERELGAETLEVMHAVKTALDPGNILNPGKVFVSE